MSYVSDSDGDNSLPPLPPEWINRDQLRDVFSILSDGSKLRIRAEARGTSMEKLYDEISVNGLSLELPLDSNGFPESDEAPLVTNRISEQQQILEHPENREGSRDQTNRPTDSIHENILKSSPLRHQMLANVEDNASVRQVSGRSLRKRTFASRHPYIADQADWLGICTVDSINEMFNDDEDVTKVVRALNQLYLKRKKRYPDEDRYKSKNFYAHLGKSKLLALAGDSDVSNRDVIEQMSQNAEEVEYETDGKDNDDNDDQLIPYEGIMSSLPGSNVPEGYNDTTYFDERDYNEENYSEEEVGRDASASPESEESSEEELIKIGGRYRKLSRILRGVLPESAKRLSYFQATDPPKKPKKKIRVLEARRGLAIKKYGSTSAQSAELQRELNSFIDENHSEEEYTPNHQRFIQQEITDFTPIMAFEVSSSDSESDSLEEVFSDRIQGDLTPSFLLSKINPYVSYVDAESDSAREEDHINHMFASGSKHKPKGSSSRKANSKSQPFRKSPKAHSAEPRNLANSTHRKRIYSRSSKGTLKRRKLRSPLSHLTSHAAETPSKRPQGNHETTKQSNMYPSRGEVKEPRTKEKDERRKNANQITGGHALNEFRRDPIQSTTVFEVESSTHFVHDRNIRQVGNPEMYAPSKELLFGEIGEFVPKHLMPVAEFLKVSTIGDGHIFFRGEDSVIFTLVGKRYSLGLYRLEASSQLTERYFMQLRRLMLDLNLILDPSIRDEIHHSLRMIIKWILIAQKPPLDAIWKQLNHLLHDFTKLHTREVRQHQLVISCRLLFIYHIFIRIEVIRIPASEHQLVKSFDANCSDFWSVLFQSFSASEISVQFSPEAKDYLLPDSLAIIYSIFRSKKHFWWSPIIEALHDSFLVIDDKISLMNVVYILASIVPRHRYNWGCFLAVLSELKNEKASNLYHHFIDTCVLAVQRLSWPLEERAITQLYSTFAQRQFGNFSDETFVPRPLGMVHTRMDIPESSVFERFMGVLYNYVSGLSSKKDVKKLISKLVASSQYRYLIGRKYQIQFVNRINLVLLLFQVCDVDLSNHFLSLVESIANSKDMFIYGRTFDALVLYCDIAKSRDASIPFRALEVLFSSFCEYFDGLFGMPDLLKKAIQFLSSIFQYYHDATIFKIIRAVNLTKIPDGVLIDYLSMILISSIEVLEKKNQLSHSEVDDFRYFQKSLINFLSSQMSRIQIVQSHHQERVEDSIEITIQIWMIIASITNSQHWNIMMLQKYPYIGNLQLREQFVLFMCEEYMKSGPITESIIGEIDMILLNGLTSLSVSRYAFPLYLRLQRTVGSVFCFKKGLILGITTISQLKTLRQQILNLVIQNVCSLATLSKNIKISYLRHIINYLQHEYTRNYSVTVYVDFCKQIVELMQRAGKSLLRNLDEFWEFSVQLGFCNRKMQVAWSQSTEIDRLQMLNNELLDALQYNKELKPALDKWISMSDMSAVYSLVQIYISAVLIHESHWAHLSILLGYIHLKLEDFTVKVQEYAFKKFLKMLIDIAAISTGKVNSNTAIFQLNALSTCLKILRHAFYIYSGYKDQSDIVSFCVDFMEYKFIDSLIGSGFELSSLFTNLTFGMLRNSSHSSYTPKSQHTPEEHSKLCTELDDEIKMLRTIVGSEINETNAPLDFNFEF